MIADEPILQEAEEPRGRGRPTSYRPEFVEQIRKLCELGATDYEIAGFFNVSTVTIHRWRIEHEDFCNASVVGKEAADNRVERAMYQRAVGYSFESEKVFQNNGQIVRADLVEHVPPDPGAAKHWLANRRPEAWREKVAVEHSGPNGGPMQTVGITTTDPVEAAKAYQRLINGAED